MICSQSLVLLAISSSLAIVTASSGLPAIAQLPDQTVSNRLLPKQIAATSRPTPKAEIEPETDAEIESGADPEVENTGEETNAESQEILTESERVRRKLLIQGDAEYAVGNLAAAEALYRQAKDESWLVPDASRALPPEPFADERLLSPAGGVYWRESQAGIENNRLSQTVVALQLLTQEAPAFVSGHLRYAAVLKAEGQLEEASGILEQALTLYPGQTDLLLAQVDLYMSQGAWLEAAIASRQFVALNNDHPQSATQAVLAAENLERFQNQTRDDIREDAIANAFTGILSYAFTGSIFGPFTAADSAIMLLQGENQIGHRIASQIQQRLPMLEQPEALGYVRRIGNRLAAATGRHDLEYEFFVILDPTLNAFALPGGKIFINAGAILKTRSEAELAGLIAHEISHSVLSHGFQMVARGNLSSSLAQYLPYGGLINNVFLSGYSRTMERQADIVGTQIMAAGGYAADGLYNVMITLQEENAGQNPPAWLASHPNTEDRVAYLQNLVERGGYNRYAYEGIASHEEVQAIVARQLAAYQASKASETRQIEDNTDGNQETEAIPEAQESSNNQDSDQDSDQDSNQNLDKLTPIK